MKAKKKKTNNSKNKNKTKKSKHIKKTNLKIKYILFFACLIIALLYAYNKQMVEKNMTIESLIDNIMKEDVQKTPYQAEIEELEKQNN